MKPDFASEVLSETEREASYRELLSRTVSLEKEVGRLVAYYMDCRNMGVPISIAAAVQDASCPQAADRAARLMLVADLLLDTREQ